MTVHPIPSDFESRTNQTYDALMWALSRPGLARDLPATGMAQIVETLIDRECLVFCDQPALQAVVARTGAELVSLDAADHVFFDTPPDASVLKTIQMGSDLYPDRGATLVCNAKLTGGQALRLSGPGCDGDVTVRVDGIPDGFWQTREMVMRYPAGFELFLVDQGRVLGIPRSTKVEVL